jgi:hypothetical protein
MCPRLTSVLNRNAIPAPSPFWGEGWGEGLGYVILGIDYESCITCSHYAAYALGS